MKPLWGRIYDCGQRRETGGRWGEAMTDGEALGRSDVHDADGRA